MTLRLRIILIVAAGLLLTMLALLGSGWIGAQLQQERIATLAQQGIRTRDDLADLAVDELVEMAGIDEERAKALISVARAHWFEE